MSDTSVFELCKQVYEATGWDTNSMFIDDTPRYTSDYILEKLPGLIGITSVHMDDVHTEVRKLRPGESPSGATYQSNVKGLLIGAGGDTPLQALLKLTLKLHVEGLL